MDEVVSLKKQRRASGQERRKHVARSAHGEWKKQQGRRNAFDVLRAAETDRLPHLLRLKHQRMAMSPFSYFRGAAPVMAYDLGPLPHTGLLCQLCGDAHVHNLGAFAAPDGRMVFDINDFDETLVGPFEWDVKRLATSLHLAAREAGLRERECREAVGVFAHRYVRSIEIFAAMPVLEIARYQIHRETELATMQGVFAKAERATPQHLRDALTERVGDRSTTASCGTKEEGRRDHREAPTRVFRPTPPLLQRLAKAQAAQVMTGMAPYLATLQPERRHLLRRYRPVDVAFKVVGTGSVGLRDYVVYLEGNGPDDPLFLQIKQEVPSVWSPYVPEPRKTARGEASEGLRVVNGQRAMQVQSDPFLGWTRLEGRDYLVRQLNDHKGSLELDRVGLDTLLPYADLCGELLARGHARSGDPDALGGYLGHSPRFGKAIVTFARAYADQTEQDWKALKRLL